MPSRYNPPPGWPQQPPGWMPPAGWQPDPSWPDPPQGWPLWVEDAHVTPPADTDFLWAIGGGAAVFLGSLLPFVSSSSVYGTVTVHSGAKATSAVFGLILVGLSLALRSAPQNKKMPFGIPLLCLAGLGALGYIGFTAAGIIGTQQQTGLGFTVKTTYSPSIGIIMAILGCAAAGFGAIRSLAHRNN